MTTARPRARLLSTTIAMVQELGVHAAGVSELLTRSSTSRNSLYQHFPAGKGQLVETATRIVTRLVHSHLGAMADTLAEGPPAEQWLDELFGFWRDPLAASDYRLGSFMMAAALDEPDPVVRSAAGQAFTLWSDRLAEGMVAAGMSASIARSTASLLLSVIEGAIVQSRALGSDAPFDDARTQLAVLLEHHLACAR